MRMAISAACILISACAGLQQEPAPVLTRAAAQPAPQPASNPWSEPARKVLIEHCGQCHLGSLPTANRRAMAIYDLAEERWDARLKPENYPGLTRRVDRQGSQQQKATVEKYVRCTRDRICDGG